MILRRTHGNDSLAVGKRQHGGFLSLHEFLDDDAIPRVAESLLLHQKVDSLDGLLRRLRQNYALARRKTVRLDCERLTHLPDINVGAGRVAEDFAARRGNAIAAHDDLRVDLRAFQLGGALRRAESFDSRRHQRIHDAVHQRNLRPDHHQTDILLFRQRNDCVVILDGNARNALGKVRNAGIARNGVQLIRMLALTELPRQRVLAPAAADQQNIHIAILSIYFSICVFRYA